MAGRKIQRSTKCTNRDDAIKFVNETITPLVTAQSVGEVAGRVQMVLAGGTPLLLTRVWDAWAELPVPRRMSSTKLGSYKTPWRAFLRWMRANHPSVDALNGVRLEHAEAFMETLAGRAGRTRFNYRRVLRRIFRDLAAHAGQHANPWDQVPVPRIDSEGYHAFTPEQLQLIGRTATGMIRHIFVVGAYTGLRLSDIARLRWAPAASPDDMTVDVAAGFIHGRMSKTRARARSMGFIELPILPPLAVYLEGLPRVAGEPVHRELLEQYTRDRHVLSTAIQDYLTGLGLQTRQDVPGRDRTALVLGVHSLRHTFVFQAGMAGIPLAIVQRIVGHMSEQMTMLYNQHARRADLAAHAARIPDLMGLATPPPPTVEAAELEALLAKLDGPEDVKSAIRSMLRHGD